MNENVLLTIISLLFVDPQHGDGELSGHDGTEVGREDRLQLLPRSGRQSSVCVHETPPGHVRRQLPGRVERPWAGEPGALSRHEGQSGVGVRRRGEDDQARELGQLSDPCDKRRSVDSAAATVRLHGRAAVADEFTVQMAGERRRS